MLSREQIQIKTPQQVRLMRRAGLVVADIHAALRKAVRAGITTAELDAVSAGVIEAVGRGEARAELTMVAISPMTSARTRM